MILVDSNIPMYLVGSPHAHKSDAQRLLEQLVIERQRLVTDAEVLQEILHRYVAINRRDAIQPTFDALLGVVDQVLDVNRTAVERAKQIVLGHRRLSARDALHLAVMEQHGIERILIPRCGIRVRRVPWHRAAIVIRRRPRQKDAKASLLPDQHRIACDETASADVVRVGLTRAWNLQSFLIASEVKCVRGGRKRE